MTRTARIIRGEVKEVERALQEAKDRLAAMEMACFHKYPKEPTYDPIYEKSYEIPGDAPGTMGIDFRGPTYVPSKTTPRWIRVCEHCGKTQTTTVTHDQTRKVPVF